MTAARESDTGIQLLDQRVTSIENNMPSKSDIAIVTQKVDELKSGFSAVEKLADKIDKLITQSAKRDETDKHLQLSVDRLYADNKSLKDDNIKFKEYIAADAPYKDMRGWVIKGVISFIVLGILSAAFMASK